MSDSKVWFCFWMPRKSHLLLPGLEQTIPGHGDIPALSSRPALRHIRTETKEL